MTHPLLLLLLIFIIIINFSIHHGEVRLKCSHVKMAVVVRGKAGPGQGGVVGHDLSGAVTRLTGPQVLLLLLRGGGGGGGQCVDPAWMRAASGRDGPVTFLPSLAQNRKDRRTSLNQGERRPG